MKFPARARYYALICTMGFATGPAMAGPGDTELVSVDPLTGAPTGGALTLERADMDRVISRDGRYIVFHRDGRYWRHDRQQGTRALVGAAPDLARRFSASMSPDGRFVAFSSAAANLVAGDTNGRVDTFVRDMTTGIIDRVSVNSAGEQQLDGDSSSVSISGDGRFVAFVSNANSLDPPNAVNGRNDVFVRDRQLGTTQRVAGYWGNSVPSSQPSLSADGYVLSFSQPWTGTFPLVYTTELQPSLGLITESDRADQPWLSADGRYVAQRQMPYRYDGDYSKSQMGIIVIHRDPNDLWGAWADRSSFQETSNGASWSPSVSDDGRFVAFVSSASNLVPNDTNGKDDVFVRDMQLKATWRVSVGSDGQEANDSSLNAAISADGRYVAFSTMASNLAAGDVNGASDVFVHENPPTSGPQAYTLTPRAASFGSQTLNVSGESKEFRIENTGATLLVVREIRLRGRNPGAFNVLSYCPTLAPRTGCSILVEFYPSFVGEASALLEVDAGTNVSTSALSGTGVLSSFKLYPRAMYFGTVPVNTTSAARSVTIVNTGLGVLPVSAILRWGTDKYQFVPSKNCVGSIPVDGRCQFSVRFKPTSAGPKVGNVKVVTWVGNRSRAKSVEVHGTGT